MGREVKALSLRKCLRARTARIPDIMMLRAFSTIVQYVCMSSPIPGEGDAFIAARLSGSVYVQQDVAVLSYSGDSHQVKARCSATKPKSQEIFASLRASPLSTKLLPISRTERIYD